VNRVAASLVIVASALGSGCSASLPASTSMPPEDGGAASDAKAPTTVLVGPTGAHAFLPVTLTIPVGTTVQWLWSSAGHTVTSGVDGTPDGKFCSPTGTPSCANAPTSAAGATFEVTFTKAGTFPYYCAPHVSDGMKGTIIVTDAP
jgi:plastocyanin